MRFSVNKLLITVRAWKGFFIKMKGETRPSARKTGSGMRQETLGSHCGGFWGEISSEANQRGFDEPVGAVLLGKASTMG